nr:PREDICTED: C-X-C chemokine receptor type 5 [Anolis carolinensis]|eukprot:XP_008122146.1 PREDICTED: C-X-C chemokine receptor type 5 [Anolis carolinensis]
MADYSIAMEDIMGAYNYSEPDGEWNYSDYICVDEPEAAEHFGKFLVPAVHLLIFLLGGLGNLLVMVTLWRYRRARTPTEVFLFHFALANLLLVAMFPFGAAESLAGWVFGTVLCKGLSAATRVSFYSSSLLLAGISVDRYLAVVHALRTFQRPRSLSVHLTCLAVWLLSVLLAMPDLLFTEVWPDSGNLSICYFKKYGEQGVRSWLATRFLYHVVGFFLPAAVMCFCYLAIVRLLCRSQRLQRQKAVKVAILVTCVFLLCWTPFHVVTFWDTLTRLAPNSCAHEYSLAAAIALTELLGYSHCGLNPFLYAFVGERFRHDACRVLHDLGCLSQGALQNVVGSRGVESTTETTGSNSRHQASPCAMNPLGSSPPPVATGQWLRAEAQDPDQPVMSQAPLAHDPAAIIDRVLHSRCLASLVAFLEPRRPVPLVGTTTSLLPLVQRSILRGG